MKRKISRKLLLALLVLAGVALIFAGCARDEQEIAIGVAGAHSGDLASYGIPSVNAAQLVVDMWNENGGVMGRQVRLIVEDDVCQPEIAVNTAAKLVGDGVVGVVGHICSGATRAALGTYVESEIPVISPSATSPSLTQDGQHPNFFRTIASDDAQARLQVDFVINELGLSRVAVLHDQGDYGRGLAEFARDFINEESGIEVVMFDGVTPGAVDYSAVINRVAQSGAEVIIYGGYHPEASRLVGQMRDRGMETLFVSGDGVMDDTFIRVAGEAAEGVYATSPMDTSTNPIAVDAAERHRARYGDEPGAFFLNAYAATQALLNAINVAESTAFADVTAALRNNSVETPLGPISFDERGDATGVGFSMYQVQNGRYVELGN